MLKGKTVVLGVSGSIAAYKIANLASGEARCYVNGVLVQTLTANVLEFSSNALDQKFLIGRDTTLRYAEGDGEYWENREWEKKDEGKQEGAERKHILTL